MNWRAILTLILVAGALFSGWSVWKQNHPDPDAAGRPGRSDYVLEEFELVSLDKQGRESFTLRAPRLSRHPDQKNIDIATPLFLIPPSENSGGDAWEVRAQNGWVSPDGDELRLRGNVHGKSMGNPADPTTMATQEMNIFPETRTATAHGPVVITRPGSILSGRGLQLNLATKRYSFKSEVRHRYVPTSR